MRAGGEERYFYLNVTARQIGSRASGQVTREGQASFDRSMMIESGPGHDWPTCTPERPCRKRENSPRIASFLAAESSAANIRLLGVSLRCLRADWAEIWI